MEGFVEPHPVYRWLVPAFFRLHRRRQLGPNGYQPLSYQEVATFAKDVIKVAPSQMELFFAVMEEADNGVLYDHYQKIISNAPKPTDKPKRR